MLDKMKELKNKAVELLGNDAVERAAWTFAQAFVAAWLVFDEPLSTEALMAALGAAFSALKTQFKLLASSK